MQDLAMDTKKAELASYQKRSANETDQDKQKELLKQHASRIVQIHSAYKIFGSSEFCNGVIAFLPSFFEKEDLEECMDMSRYIFAFTDGCFDLNTCKFRKIMPNDWVSTTTGYAYPKKDNPEVREKIKAFLYGLFENHQDDEYLIKVLASCLYGGNRWEEYYGFTGSGGNGKGVIAELMTAVFGDYYLSVDNTLFTKPLERKDQPIPALVEARCKRVMMSTEPESDDRLQAGLIKKISGGDPIEARTLHSKHIVKYKPQFKLILQMNNIPKMSKIDGGIERRMRIIMFPFKFVSADKMCETYHRLGDPDVKEKHCKSPEWRDEFMLMLTEVYKTIKDLKTLPTPSSVSNATSEYIDDNNPLKLWLNKHYNITKDENHKIGASDLKRAYLEDTGVEKIADASFKSLLEFNGVVRKRETTGVVYVGLKRKAPEGMIADA
jgi:P4 family phage/plasmid primase-like protien